MSQDTIFRERLDLLIIFQTWAYANPERQRANLGVSVFVLPEGESQIKAADPVS